MANYTSHYNLKKPLQTENYNVDDFNGNADIVDTSMQDLQDNLDFESGRVDAVEDRLDLAEPAITSLETDKVDKVVGKQLSTEDYTTAEKEALNVTIPAQLAEKVQNFKIKNEVVNGDFADGVNSWTFVSGATNGGITGNEITILNSAGDARGIYQVIPNPESEKVYLYFEVYSSENITQINIGNQSRTATSILNTWNKYSSIQAITTITRFYARATNFKLRKPMYIKLTSVFGAGNEPTELEMDELIKVIPNSWWDGELSLTQKQLITWQLNLIRKNTNAIIALGGTIV